MLSIIYVRVGNQWGYLDEDGTFIQEDDEEKKDEACWRKTERLCLRQQRPCASCPSWNIIF